MNFTCVCTENISVEHRSSFSGYYHFHKGQKYICDVSRIGTTDEDYIVYFSDQKTGYRNFYIFDCDNFNLYFKEIVENRDQLINKIIND